MSKTTPEARIKAAEKLLAEHKYVIGKSSTKGMEEPLRSTIKKALRTIQTGGRE